MSWTRVETWQAYHTENNPDFYDVVLHLSLRGRIGPGGGGDTAEFPYQPPEALPAGLVQYKGDAGGTVTLDTVPTDGNLIMVWASGRTGYPTTPSGMTIVASGSSDHGATVPAYGRLWTKIASGETGTYSTAPSGGAQVVAMEFTGTLDQVASQNDLGRTTVITAGGAVTPTKANAIVVGCADTDGFFGVSMTPDAGVTEIWDSMTPGGVPPSCWVGYKTVATPASTIVGGTLSGSEYFGGVTFSVVGAVDPADFPPSSGQMVPWEVVAMTTVGGVSTGTTAFPYAGGTLQVKVNGIVITPASFTESIPDCGDFALAWEVDPDETVSASYLGR